MNLSRNFSLQELTKSDTAIRKGIDNNPNADQIEKIKTNLRKSTSASTGSIRKSKSN
jgi:hypothetical protein